MGNTFCPCCLAAWAYKGKAFARKWRDGQMKIKLLNIKLIIGDLRVWVHYRWWKKYKGQ